MASTYVATYLRGDPDNLEALELQGRILADTVRDYRPWRRPSASRPGSWRWTPSGWTRGSG